MLPAHRKSEKIVAFAIALALVLAASAGCVDWRAPPAQSGTPAIAVATARSSPTLSVGVSDEEFIGPFASWADVKTTFGAVGDGIADDTAAIQRGLNSLRKYNSATGPAVLYFPAGSYRITSTLTMELNTGASVVGADPSVTSIVWAGPPNGTMLLTSGSFDTLFARLTWDGKYSAGIGVAQWWNVRVDGANFQGTIKHIDEVFQNLGIGIYGGRLGADYGQGDSETLIERVKFISNSVAGVNLGSWNALNWWIWDSQFTNCARGVSNIFSVNDNGPTAGAGNFLVYRNLFQGSTIADVSIGNNVPWFSVHNNVSIGSQQFINASATGANNSPILVQNNTVIETLNPVSIQIGNEGPLILVDNQIRSSPGVTGPVVQLDGLGSAGDRDVLSIGNRYTTSDPIAYLDATGRLLSIGDSTVSAASISSTLPSLPGVAQNYQRAVFEVPVGASATQIQTAINSAAASGADNAVVHIPAGNYQIAQTLIVPAQAHLQIAGDSEATTLSWSGGSANATVLSLAGPSYATLRDIRIVGAHATAIDISNADQPGGRVFIEGSMLGAVNVEALTNTRIDARASTQLTTFSVDASGSVLSIGGAGLGPISVTSNSNVLVSDSWYEGDRADLFRGNSGNFTYLGGNLAPYSNGVQTGQSPTTASILLNNFAGQVSFIAGWMTLPSASNGIVVTSASASTSALFFGMSGTVSGYFADTASAGDVGMLYAKLYTPGVGAVDLPDWGTSNATFIADGFRQARSVIWETAPLVHTPGATDVRLFRVFTSNAGVGLSVEQ